MLVNKVKFSILKSPQSSAPSFILANTPLAAECSEKNLSDIFIVGQISYVPKQSLMGVIAVLDSDVYRIQSACTILVASLPCCCLTILKDSFK